jgi:hypothetical protein
MRKKIINKTCLLLIIFISLINGAVAQDSIVKQPVVKLNYFSVNNTIPYLLVQTQLKEGKKYLPEGEISGTLYMDGDSSETNLMGKFKTDKNGVAKLILPAASQQLWNSAAQHNFKAEASGKGFESTAAEITITKSKITIDTSSDETTKSITVTVTQLKDKDWVPAKDVEMKIGISRLNSLLPVGDEETYTTDSSGQVTAEFKKDTMSGDIKGNIILTAKVEENEFYGNLSVEKTVPWGVYKVYENNFNKRTLWGTRDKTPLWLLFMAYSIIAGVWGVFVYLIFQLIKIRKLGKSAA